jgi:predicted nucleotidyltransferase
MNNALLDLSGKIDGALLDLFEALTRVALSEGARFFVVGAMARDLILVHGYNLHVRRATEDVDVGICVANWQEFDKLRQGLLDTGDFEASREVQQVVFRRSLRVDLLPFGPIAEPTDEINWPRDRDITLSVAGFEEAYEFAQPVRLRLDPPLDIQVASPAGVALLKIVAWGDRQRRRDAQDLAYLVINYLDAGNYDRILGEESDLSQIQGLDYALAGARLLGRDVGRIARPRTKERVLEILEEETADDSRFRLVQQMMPTPPLSDEEFDQSFERLLGLLRELEKGIREA